MSGAIDTTLGAIPSDTVHSRVGACDPRSVFAKRILNGDSHRAPAIASLSYLRQKNLLYACGTAKLIELNPIRRSLPLPNEYRDAPMSLGVGCGS
jgi:hypothetical protein